MFEQKAEGIFYQKRSALQKRFFFYSQEDLCLQKIVKR